jgi:hypothetical protein
VANIITLTDFKAWAGITNNDDDNRINTLIDATTGIIEDYTRRTWGEIATYTQYFDIDDDYRQLLMVDHYPIVTVISVTDDDNLIDPSEYNVHEAQGTIRYDDDEYWTKGPKKVVVVYTAGSETIPETLKMACRMQVKYFLDHRDDQGVANEKMGNYSVTYKENDGMLLPTVKKLLDLHRKLW